MSDLDNIRRGELKRLLRHRGVSEIEVRNSVEDILAERRRWTSAALGERVQLTFEEKTGRGLGINTIACIDRTEKMMRLFFRERKRDRDRRRVSKMREKITKSSLSPRARQLASMLNGEWIEGRALGDSIQKRWKLKRGALEKAVRRASQELSEAGLAESKYGAGSRGSRVLFLRLKKPMNIEVSEHREVSYIDKISTLRKGDSKVSAGQCPPDKNESLPRRSSIKPGTSRDGPLHENESRLTESSSIRRLSESGTAAKRVAERKRSRALTGRRAPQHQAASDAGRCAPYGGQPPCAPEPAAMSGLKEWSAPELVEMPYTPELRALYYNMAGLQGLDLVVADRSQSRQVSCGVT
jgi:hypothetical protein